MEMSIPNLKIPEPGKNGIMLNAEGVTRKPATGNR